MSHTHGVVDADKRFTVDIATMAIIAEGEPKPLKQGDHNAERHGFKMPRYIEGHDMSLCNKVEAHFINSKYDAETRETTVNKGFDFVDDFRVCADDENAVEWSWLVSGDATQLDGTLAFCFRFACMDGDKIQYQKFTGTFDGIPVGASIFNTEAVAREYADVLEQWKQEILANGGGGLDEEAVAEIVKRQTADFAKLHGEKDRHRWLLFLVKGKRGNALV